MSSTYGVASGPTPAGDFAAGKVTKYGGGSASFQNTGNINTQVASAGINPGSTGNDNVLAVFSLPAGSLDAVARALSICASGSFGATGNNKRLKIIFGATTAVVGSAVVGGATIADTGTVATNGGGWSLQANVTKYGAAGANTQLGTHVESQVGAAVAALLAPVLLTAAENAVILIAITGNATTAVGDIIFNLLNIVGAN